jgi:hypothetical protein
MPKSADFLQAVLQRKMQCSVILLLIKNVKATKSEFSHKINKQSK